MRRFALLAAAAAAALPAAVRAESWSVSDDWSASEIGSAFNWIAGPDNYTNGLVVYQSQSAATQQNLTSVTGGEFFMRVSTQETATEGRPSVRIESKKLYSDGVYVLNVSHVPVGCSTWPAFWTTTAGLDGEWPIGGEIDIIENANDEFGASLTTLHTASGCSIAKSIPAQTATVIYTNCSAYNPDRTGCQSEMNGTSVPTWGAALNRAGGGFFAMARSFGTSGKGVRVWYWARGSEPSDLKSGSTSVNPENWGKPNVWYNVSQQCHGDFNQHKIVFDTTLGGDWAANTYARSGCQAKWGPITDQVSMNGSSYDEAYWAVGGLRVFASGGGNDNAANSPITTTSSSSDTSGTRTSAAAPGVLGSTAALGGAALLAAAVGVLLL